MLDVKLKAKPTKVARLSDIFLNGRSYVLYSLFFLLFDASKHDYKHPIDISVNQLGI